jgi:hypothetical protein
MNKSPKVVHGIQQRTLCSDEIVPSKIALEYDKDLVRVNTQFESKIQPFKTMNDIGDRTIIM